MSFTNFACNRPFYHPDRTARATPDLSNVDYEDVFFETADGATLHGYFMPAVAEPKGAVLHLHGNAANVSGHWPFVGWLPAEGYHVLTFDYRGYGRSEGRVTRQGTVEDAEAALTFLRQRPEVDGAQVAVFGQSLGGALAPVLVVSNEDAICGFIIDAGFSSYRRVAEHHTRRNPLLTVLAWWYPMCLDDSFEPLDAIRKIDNTPKLIMHGDADQVVPVEMATELFIGAKEPKTLWIIPGGSHYSIWNEGGREARRRVTEFLSACFGRHEVNRKASSAMHLDS